MTQVKLVNLTPHEVRIRGKNEEGKEQVICLPPSHTAGIIASESHADTLEVSGVQIELIRRSYLKPKGIPPRARNTLFIVSEKTALMHPREDLVVPVHVRKSRSGRRIAEALAAVSQQTEEQAR